MQLLIGFERFRVSTERERESLVEFNGYYFAVQELVKRFSPLCVCVCLHMISYGDLNLMFMHIKFMTRLKS